MRDSSRQWWAIKYRDIEETQFKVPDAAFEEAMKYFKSFGYDVGSDGYYADPFKFSMVSVNYPKPFKDPLNLFSPPPGGPHMKVYLHTQGYNPDQGIVEMVEDIPPITALQIIYIPSNPIERDELWENNMRTYTKVDFPLAEEPTVGFVVSEEGARWAGGYGVDLIIDTLADVYRIEGVMPCPVDIYDLGKFQGTIFPPNRVLAMDYEDFKWK